MNWYNRLSKIKWWFYHRFHPQHKYYMVNTGLKPSYYDKDELILHACFNLLKDFVEHELAWMALICSDERVKVPWWMSLKRYRDIHYKRLALGHLTYWEYITEKEADRVWCMSPESLYEQRSSDKEILDLYIWWTETRPNRPNPYDGCYEKYKNYIKAVVPDDGLSKAFDQEMFYNQEDNDMLIRLIKIRENMWT